MRTVYFKTCEHPLFENNCEKLKKLIKTNFYIFKLKNPIEFEDFYIKMNEDQNEIWWTKEDRKLLFLRITLRGIVIYLRRNVMIEAYDDSQPIQISENRMFLTSPIMTDIDDEEILNILNKVFGMKPYSGNFLTGFDIEARII